VLAIEVHDPARAENHVTRNQGAEGRSRKFEDIYTGSYREIAGYVRRRVAPDAADDVIAHIYAVAWRRFDTFRRRRRTGCGCSA
jgi:DNA-directed RNA polymerase specialized sigma24 family protein